MNGLNFLNVSYFSAIPVEVYKLHLADVVRTAKQKHKEHGLKLSHNALKMDGTLFPDTLKMKVSQNITNK
jgi:hypothetical protein